MVKVKAGSPPGLGLRPAIPRPAASWTPTCPGPSAGVPSPSRAAESLSLAAHAHLPAGQTQDAVGLRIDVCRCPVSTPVRR